MPSDTNGHRRVADRYELTEMLGSGGTGQVWRARDELLERQVAIKQVEVPPQVSEQERADINERVMREARAAARLNHRGATTVYDVLEDGGRTYIVMELVTAPTLAEVVDRDGPLSPHEAARLGLALLDTLAAAHRMGIVHRDVKPANVMVPPGGPPKLTDFGIAAIADDPRITTTGLVLGSPAFMSPEQAQGHDVEPATDLWSLGATLYFAVEGKLPFERERAIATLNAVVREDHRPMRAAGPLEHAIARLLDKDPRTRPGADEARRLLDAALEAPEDEPTSTLAATQAMAAVGGTEVLDQTPAAEPEARPEPRPQPRPEPRPGPRRPSPPPVRDDRGGRGGRMLAVLGGLLLVAIIAAALFLRGDGTEEPVVDDTGAPAADTGEQDEPEPPADDAEEPADEPVETEPGQEPTDGAPTDAVTEAPTDLPPGELPQGWQPYEPSGEPYRVGYPADWEVIPRSGNRTDLTDPSTGAYLRVDWTDSPASEPYADWERYEERFSSERSRYERIRLERTTVQGEDAALWEYRYEQAGTMFHAYNLNIATDDFGYALNFQTPESRWDEMEPMFASFRDTFEFRR